MGTVFFFYWNDSSKSKNSIRSIKTIFKKWGGDILLLITEVLESAKIFEITLKLQSWTCNRSCAAANYCICSPALHCIYRVKFEGSTLLQSNGHTGHVFSRVLTKWTFSVAATGRRGTWATVRLRVRTRPSLLPRHLLWQEELQERRRRLDAAHAPPPRRANVASDRASSGRRVSGGVRPVNAGVTSLTCSSSFSRWCHGLVCCCRDSLFVMISSQISLDWNH